LFNTPKTQGFCKRSNDSSQPWEAFILESEMFENYAIARI